MIPNVMRGPDERKAGMLPTVIAGREMFIHDGCYFVLFDVLRVVNDPVDAGLRDFLSGSEHVCHERLLTAMGGNVILARWDCCLLKERGLDPQLIHLMDEHHEVVAEQARSVKAEDAGDIEKSLCAAQYAHGVGGDQFCDRKPGHQGGHSGGGAHQYAPKKGVITDKPGGSPCQHCGNQQRHGSHVASSTPNVSQQ